MSVNKLILLGRLGQEPELKTLENGKNVCRISVATSESYKDSNGEKQEITDWHNVIFWGDIAKVINKFFSKGSQIYLEGKSRTRSWKDSNGVEKYTTEVIANNFSFVDKKDVANTSPNNSPTPLPGQDLPDDDLPF